MCKICQARQKVTIKKPQFSNEANVLHVNSETGVPAASDKPHNFIRLDYNASLTLKKDIDFHDFRKPCRKVVS